MQICVERVRKPLQIQWFVLIGMCDPLVRIPTYPYIRPRNPLNTKEVWEYNHDDEVDRSQPLPHYSAAAILVEGWNCLLKVQLKFYNRDNILQRWKTIL